MNELTNGATIEVVATGKQYHTLKDWGLAIGNNNYIGDPEEETYYVDVPGADGFLDYTETTTGRRVFKNRSISIKCGGKKPRNNWDIFISKIRNLIEGRIVKIIFDNDPGFYWTGRAAVRDFDRTREIGTFTISIPKAEPYKYSVNDSTEDWLWDALDFETGIIDEGADIILGASDSISYTIIPDLMPFVPVVWVSSMGDEGISMMVAEETYQLVTGRNRFADIVVDQEEITLTFSGSGQLSIIYRRGSL